MSHVLRDTDSFPKWLHHFTYSELELFPVAASALGFIIFLMSAALAGVRWRFAGVLDGTDAH